MRDLTPETVSNLRVWNAAVRLETFTVHDLSADASFCHRRVGILIREWRDQGLLIELEQKGIAGRSQFRMQNEGRIPEGMSSKAQAVRKESLHGNLWNAMRMSGEFTPRDLMAVAATERTPVGFEDAAAYCRLLCRGDEPYLRVIEKAVPGKHDATYRLVRKTGPLPPRERRIRGIYDPNIKVFTHGEVTS